MNREKKSQLEAEIASLDKDIDDLKDEMDHKKEEMKEEINETQHKYFDDMKDEMETKHKLACKVLTMSQRGSKRYTLTLPMTT